MKTVSNSGIRRFMAVLLSPERSNSVVLLLQPKNWKAPKIPFLGFQKPLEMNKVKGKYSGFSSTFRWMDVKPLMDLTFGDVKYSPRFLMQAGFWERHD